MSMTKETTNIQKQIMKIAYQMPNHACSFADIKMRVNDASVDDLYGLDHTPYALVGGDKDNPNDLRIKLTSEGIAHVEDYLQKKKMTFVEWQKLWIAYIALGISLVSLAISIYDLVRI